MELSTCRVCQGKTLHRFLSLGLMPLANGFLREDQLSMPEPYYPLDVYYCNTCRLVQIGFVVPPEVLFKDYPYLTGPSEPMKAHFARLAEDLIQRFNLFLGGLVVDIGSNDGTLLKNFQKQDYMV